MQAVFVNVSIEGTGEESINELRSEVVPRVSQAQGFVAGYWTRSETSGRACIIFDSESTAQQAAGMIRNAPPTGVTIENVEVREVIASA
jgi:hypothetical protein